MRKFIFIVLIFISSPCFADNFRIRSESWRDGTTMDNTFVLDGFGCHGNNMSPQVGWTGAPDGTRSFAVTLFDPDAPTGSGWWHWTVFNIPADNMELKAGAGSLSGRLPVQAVQGRTDFGQPGYGGACPPAGNKPHRYILTVYALKVDKIDLDANASGAMLSFYLKQQSLAEDFLTVYYGR
ncbi:MAG: YbhB/YbcL family Raf kinase inhibitor-like protein [Candidatus Omnitrophota bacterium]